MAAVATPNSRQPLSRSSSSTAGGPATPPAALEAVGARPRRIQKRPTRQASYELCNHAKAYLEGGQYASGYDFLCHLLAAGTSISTPAQPHLGLLAPPAYLGFAASLVVDPKTTTKARSQAARRGGDAALRYLRCVHTTIDGPAYAAIRQAFRFPAEHSRRRGRNPRRAAAASLSPAPGDDIELLAGDAANAASLWAQAEDFWQLVGWAFNCSVLHKKRWARWQLWLDMMLDFLHADWEWCLRRSRQDVDGDARLQESLLWHYIVGEAGHVNRGTRRRIVKAVLANASADSLKDYPEIWDKETEGPKRRKDDEQLGQVDFETGDMGGYDDDEETQDAPGQVVEGDKHDEHGNGDGLHGAMEQLGGIDAMELRQRLMALIVQVAQTLPKDFTTISDFFDNILEDVIRLPTTIFEVFISTLKLPPRLHVPFCANLLLPLVSGKVLNFFHLEPTQPQLESTLLILKGTTQSFAANAKVSLLVEQIFAYMISQDALQATDTLRIATETGIAARQSVYGTGKGKRSNAEEELLARALLEACSERLLGMLEILELKAGKPPQQFDANNRTGPSLFSFGTGSSLSDAPGSETEDE